MNSWEKLPIGELFSLEKGSLQSTKCTSGDYTFITASSEWKTHNEYSHDCEALIYAVAASGSLGRCHHYNGKFISSDLCFILRAKDEKKRPINFRFYQNVFRFLKDDIVAKTKAGTSKESISQKRFAAYKLPYIDIEHQSFWENKLNNLNDKIENFEVESSNQSSYLTKLRQAILQEAIEGKLTVDWRTMNPVRKGNPDYDAESLMEKIQTEKEKLIKEGKIKKQKPLAPIKKEEVPFELPEGWVWTRLGEISEGFQYGSSAKSLKDGKVPVLRMGNIQDGKIDWNGLVYTNNKNEIEQYVLKKGDLLFNRTNSRELVGKTAVFDGLKDAIFAGYLVRFSPLAMCSSEYFNFIMNSTLHREWCNQNKTDAIGQSNINATKLRDFLFPLAPLAEQQAIVDRVEKLLSMVDELEKQVSERKEQSEQLMQAVLREAFERGK